MRTVPHGLTISHKGLSLRGSTFSVLPHWRPNSQPLKPILKPQTNHSTAIIGNLPFFLSTCSLQPFLTTLKFTLILCTKKTVSHFYNLKWSPETPSMAMENFSQEIFAKIRVCDILMRLPPLKIPEHRSSLLP